MNFAERVRAMKPSWWPGEAGPAPLPANHNEQAEHYHHLEKVANRAADLSGAFSLFALISVLALAAGAKQLALPISSFSTPDEVWRTIYVPWLIPFVIGAVALWVMNRHWLKMALALKFRRDWRAPFGSGGGTPWSKVFVIAVGVIIAGAVITLATKLQDTGRQMDAREGAVMEQQLGQERATLVAQRERIEQRLTEMRNHENQYMAVAATVGAEEFARTYLSDETLANETAARRGLLERSLGAARVADQLEADILALDAQIAALPVEAEVAREVDIDRGALSWIEELFLVVPLWLALAIEAIALVMKFLETVFRRLKNEALANPVATIVAPEPAAPNEPSEPSAEIIALADWRGQQEDEPKVNEDGEAVDMISSFARRRKKATA